jgi:hypothetical protein|nr:MAG TPA: hypothetical protein [Caudoviricetes sp.]
MKNLLKGTFGVLAATCVAVIATDGDVTVSIIAYDVLVLAALILIGYLLYTDDAPFLIEWSNNAD